jgi:DNA-binding MarR family transcriptional regulator
MADQRPIGFWLRLVDRLIDEQFAKSLDEHGVTRRQWQLLNVLMKGRATLSELDAAISPFLDDEDGETAADHLAELVESEWVTIADGTYELTARGTGAFERLSTVVGAQRTALADGITEDDYRTTTATLERMAWNLGWSDS